MYGLTIFFIPQTEPPNEELKKMALIVGIDEVAPESDGFYYLDIYHEDDEEEEETTEIEELKNQVIEYCRDLNQKFPQYSFRVNDGSQFGTYYTHPAQATTPTP